MARQGRKGARRPHASGLVMDLDGTLIDGDERVSPRVAGAVRAAASIMPVAIVSGREPDDVAHFARVVGLDGPQVSDNGARIIDSGTGRTLEEFPLDPADARRILTDPEERGLRFFAVDDGRMARSRAEIADWRITIIAAHTLTEVVSIEMTSAYESAPGISAVPSVDGRGTRWYINFTRAGVNKGTGVLRYASMVGIDPARVVAVGDSLNDVDMFAAVGTPVAMGNASEEVKRVADRVVAGISEDGLAEAIDRFVLAPEDGCARTG